MDVQKQQVDDCAEACLLLMEHYSDESIVNVGAGTDLSIAEIATLVAEVVGYQGSIQWDRTKPDGIPQKLLDVTKLSSLGWSPKLSLRHGLGAPMHGIAPLKKQALEVPA